MGRGLLHRNDTAPLPRQLDGNSVKLTVIRTLFLSTAFPTQTVIQYLKAGRDHLAPINPLILAGGGLKMGQTIGASDSHSAYPRERPILPEDLMATCIYVLGIEQDLQYVHPSGCPISMIHGDGRPIKELL